MFYASVDVTIFKLDLCDVTIMNDYVVSVKFAKTEILKWHVLSKIKIESKIS
jgi:hypothetical protein